MQEIKLSQDRVKQEIQEAQHYFHLAQSLLHHNRFVIIGCGKDKLNTEHSVTPDKLYTSKLFQLRLTYAKERNLAWAVCSANYGFIFPFESVTPYEVKISDLDRLNRLLLKTQAAHWLASRFHIAVFASEIPFDPKKITIEFHAGQDYYNEFVPMLKGLGFNVETPVAGLSIGHQLKLYISCIRQLREAKENPKEISR